MSRDESPFNNENLDDLDWVTIEEITDIRENESGMKRLKQKVFANPFIPLGCVATIAALCTGLRSSYQGNSQRSQYLMRARVAAQAFTVIAMVVGLKMSESQSTRNRNK